MNMGSMSRQATISWLYQIILCELEKTGDESDNDLIAECTAYLDEMQADENALTAEEIGERLATIRARAAENPSGIVFAQIPSAEKASAGKKHRKRFFKVVGVAAAIMLVLFFTVSAVAYTKGYRSAWQFAYDNATWIRNIRKGSKSDREKITVVKNAEKQEYESVNAFLQAENLHILYPVGLESKMKPGSITFVEKEGGVKTIAILFENHRTQIFINNTNNFENGNIEQYEVVTENGVVYYLDEETVQAYCRFGGCEYTISTDSITFLKQIIQEMKEYPS